MRPLRTLTLKGYMDKYGKEVAAALYVVNRADGRIAFNCKGDVSGPVTVIIPVSFAPTDLTALVSRDNIISNPQFRRMLNSNRLVIVDNEEFETMLKSNSDLREEYGVVNNIGAEEMSATIDVAVSDSEVKTQTKLADNEQAVSDPYLSSLIQECALLDNDADGSRLKEMTTGLKRKIQTYNQAQLKEFIDACPEQALREIAIEHLSYLQESN